MKNVIRNILKAIVLSFVFVVPVSCNINGEDTPKIKPHYLLDGTFYATNGNYDYYKKKGGNELYVSLKDSVKTSLTGTINVPTAYDEIPVTGIWHNAFHNTPATTINLHEGIKTIDFEAFLHSSITSITLPVSLQQIGDCAFYACSSLAVANFKNSTAASTGSSITCNCDDSGESESATFTTLQKIPTMCFFKCTALRELSLPGSIQEVGEEAFNGCSALTSTIFFQSIRIVRERAFQGCIGLRKVYVSKTLFDNDGNNIGIEPHAFNYCHADLDIRFCGEESAVTTWVNKHKKWGWKNDLGDPDDPTNCYAYRQETGDSYFTSDWVYQCNENGEVTLTEYTGPDPDEAHGWLISIPDTMAAPEGNKVIRIDPNAFSTTTKGKIRRLYLPTTLLSIENLMFRYNYSNIFVIDDNKACAGDSDTSVYPTLNDIPARIDLSGITDLEFIGIRAFAFNEPSVTTQRIDTLRLPAKIRAIGDEAFGVFGASKRSLPNVTTFSWGYSDANSRLECIGADAFYGLGCTTGGTLAKNETYRPHTASTIIFPKTFKYFGLLDTDVTRFNSLPSNPFHFSVIPAERSTKATRPAHAFLGCSLFGTVIFKGSMNSGETTDLIIPLQTFVFNESLQTIIFEERAGHKIVFHTQVGTNGGVGDQSSAQESIGSNSGAGSNDFRGEPFLQTLVLPNQYTDLYIQNLAFHANSRAAIYLTGLMPDEAGSHFYSDSRCGHWKNLDFLASPISQAKEWKTIGSEDYYSAKYNPARIGYCFTNKRTDTYTLDNNGELNSFGINQELEIYDQIHYYKQVIEAETVITTVNLGSSNTKEYVEQDKCSFVCETVNASNIATMTNYLYNLHDGSADLTTCTVPETVTDRNGEEYTVKHIGNNAFSACFCDGQDTSPKKNPGTFDDLTTVVLPNAIETIGDYAFMRAYGVTTIKSYTGNNTPTEGMPSSLEKIGKMAFAFSGLKKILKIPYECVFYENYTQTYKEACVFANAVSLRQITFLGSDNSTEGNESAYYKAITYTSKTSGTPTYTGSIYSKDANGTDYSYNKDRLLMVLNRTKADFKQTALDAALSDDTNGIRFNGQYRTNPFLFGAYKMGYWIKELVLGNPTLDSSSNVFAQPLFSGIGTRGSKGNELTVKYLYLGTEGYYYPNLMCDLDTIAGLVTKMPRYATAGCENLLTVELNNDTGNGIPDGVFKDVTLADTNYKTSPAPRGSEAHVLDLRGTGYSYVGKESFKNNASIQTFIAPDVSTFTIKDNAFENCTNLTTIDLSNVTGTININVSAFKNTGVTTIIWPDNDPSIVTVNPGNYCFQNCTSLVNATIPEGLTSFSSSMFEGCTSLVNVTTQNGGDCSLQKANSASFKGCTSLANFDFSKFPELRDFGEGSFQNTGSITSTGEMTFKDPVANANKSINVSKNAFNNSGLTRVIVTTTSITLGEGAFQNSASLASVRFIKTDALFPSHNQSLFNNCTSLTELQLTSKFNIKNGANSIISGCDTSLVIYYHGEFTSSTTSTEKWRKNGSNLETIHYFVDNVTDLSTNSLIISASAPYTVINGDIPFWTTNPDGSAMFLGTVTGWNGSIVTFSSGHTLTGTTFA